MFQFAFEGALFKFEAKRPAVMPFVTLPPQLSARTPEAKAEHPPKPLTNPLYSSVFSPFVYFKIF